MKYFAILCLLLSLTACGEFVGQKETLSNCFENCSSQNNSQNDNNKVIDLNANISGGVHDNSQAIKADIKNETLTLSLPITGGSYINTNNPNYEINGVPEAFLQIIEPSTGTTRIDLNLPLAAITKNFELPKTATLPNGEQIPTFRSGEHGFTDINVNGTNVRIYISRGHLGIYVESPFNPYVQVSYPTINKDDQIVGYFTQIPAIAHSQGAFFSSMVLSEASLENLQNLQ